MAKPIGYWLKEVDRLIEESFGRLLAEENLTRRHWQVLNTVAGGPLRVGELEAALAPFGPIGPVVEELMAWGWLRPAGDDDVALSTEGATAHAAVTGRVLANRRALTDGITAEEYASVVNLLERMAGNLRCATTGS